jgi:tryptophan-rich sensory protein
MPIPAPTTRHPILGFLGWMVVTFAAAAVGSMASVNAGSFYADLVRPDWAPPAWVFGPAWTLLYVLMGIAAWLVWRARGLRGARIALSLFVAQLVLNALWSWLFFGWRLGGLAFVDVIALWALIVATCVAFWRISPLAGALLVPYLLWVTYASALNYAIWQLNPQAFG